MNENTEFRTNNLKLLLLSSSASVINYIFQIVVGRLLSVEEYGIVNTIFSLISVLCIPGMFISVIVVRECASIHTDDSEKINSIMT